MLNEFDPDRKLNQVDSIPSDDLVYINADATMTRARHFVSSLIDEWNDKRTQQQTAVLTELDPAAKLRNLCAKFNIFPSKHVNEDNPGKQCSRETFTEFISDELFYLDTGNFFSTSSTSTTTIGQMPIENTPTAPPSRIPNIVLPNPFQKHYHFELPLHKAAVPILVRDCGDGRGHITPDIGSVRIRFSI